MPMMIIDDCLDATVKLLKAPRERLSQSVYNLTALSFTPAQLADSIRRRIPDFDISYAPDFRQHIADSWPHALDDSAFRRDLDWQPRHSHVDQLTDLMIEELGAKFKK
jgi:threonine 3-dehydrogenase